MTNSIAEIAGAKCILAIGTNTTVAHPVLSLRVKEAVARGATLIVANPKEIDLVHHADMFLRNRPGTDVPLLMGMARVIVDEGLHDAAYIAQRCKDFDVFVESLEAFPLDAVAETTGVPAESIARAARCFAQNSPAAILYAMGITQHTNGTNNVMAVANLAMLTGNVGRESGGVNPLRGQNNVQGACDMGALPNVYPGYQKVDNPEVKAKFEAAWGCTLGDKPGLTHTEIFDGICSGTVKTLYAVGENPVLSEANANHVVEALEKVDFFVAQDIFLTESARYAHVVLPAASYAEKDGTFTNTERRVQRVRQAIPPVGDSKPDWWIVCELAKRMGVAGFDFTGTRQIMEEIASVTPSYGGISHDRVEGEGLQWPCPTPDHPGTKFLHAERFAAPDGKGRFMPLVFDGKPELPDEEYPMLLTTDRSIYHFHTSTMSRRVAGLDALNGNEWLMIHPRDAERQGLVDGETVRVFSRRGRVTVAVKVTDVCPEGVVSMTFHFAETPTNVLTHNALDPVAKIPATKVCAVRIEKTAETPA